ILGPPLGRDRDAVQVQLLQHFGGGQRAVGKVLDQEAALPAVALRQFQRQAPELGGERLVDEQHVHRSASAPPSAGTSTLTSCPTAVAWGIATGLRTTFPAGRGAVDNSSCVILVPAAHYIEPHCELSLRQLEGLGYPVRRVYGFSQID